MTVYIEIGYINKIYINKMLTFDHNLQRQNSKFVKTLKVIKENVAICVGFAPLKKLYNSDCYFSGYTIFCHENYRNKNVRDGVNKTDENQDFQKGNPCT